MKKKVTISFQTSQETRKILKRIALEKDKKMAEVMEELIRSTALELDLEVSTATTNR
ncbi:hypothetical protein [Microcoleus sp.]|uniref:hypothetical protein n=1 Tax=Microcoleus sp. TaxID=44472 RepID=UPI00352631DF